MKLLAALVAMLAYAAFAQTPPPVLIFNVTVVDVVTGGEAKYQTIKIEGDRIVSVVSSQAADGSQPGAFDAHGGYLIPGLWDMHVHVHSTEELALYVANGVTGIRIMSGERDEKSLRAE